MIKRKGLPEGEQIDALIALKVQKLILKDEAGKELKVQGVQYVRGHWIIFTKDGLYSDDPKMQKLWGKLPKDKE